MTLREALRLPWDLMSVLVQCRFGEHGPQSGFASGTTIPATE